MVIRRISVWAMTVMLIEIFLMRMMNVILDPPLGYDVVLRNCNQINKDPEARFIQIGFAWLSHFDRGLP